jgi:ribosomal protein S18 acetylase RimI-like enzyme
VVKPVEPLEIVDRGPQHDAWVTALLTERWGSTHVVTRGQFHDALSLPGFVALIDGENAGLITYYIANGECEVVTLDSVVQGVGVGTALLETVRRIAEERRCERLWLVTTNDNVEALRFYQKRGLRILAIHREAIEESRDMKPEIPEIGMHGIPIRDEIEMDLFFGPR